MLSTVANLRPLWDPQRQTLIDKMTGTFVVTVPTDNVSPDILRIRSRPSAPRPPG